MDNRDNLYQKYISTHTEHLYGNRSLKGIEKEFPVWDAYFKRFLPSDFPASIIDLGCGDGGFVYWLQRRGFSFAEGIDISDEQIAESQRLQIQNVHKADAREFLRLKNNGYDVIFVRDFLEHIRKDALLVIGQDIYNALKAGGICVIQTVNAETLLSARLRYADVTHETAFTKSSIKQILRAAGFSDINVYPMRPVVHNISSLLRYIVWRGIEIFLHIVLIAATGETKGIFTQDILCVARK